MPSIQLAWQLLRIWITKQLIGIKMAYCDVCGNFDEAHEGDESSPDFQPELYYYWDAPLEEIYYWRDSFPNVDCMCEICFDIANFSKKLIWADH